MALQDIGGGRFYDPSTGQLLSAAQAAALSAQAPSAGAPSWTQMAGASQAAAPTGLSFTPRGTIDSKILDYYRNNPAFSASMQLGQPIMAGGYRITPSFSAINGSAEAGTQSGGEFNGVSAWDGTSPKYQQYDAQGNYLGDYDVSHHSLMEKIAPLIPALFSGGAALAAGGAAGGAGAAAGGFAGDAAAAGGAGAADAAAAAAADSAAAGGFAGGAGITGFGDAGMMYAGGDAAAAGSLGSAAGFGGAAVGGGLAGLPSGAEADLAYGGGADLLPGGSGAAGSTLGGGAGLAGDIGASGAQTLFQRAMSGDPSALKALGGLIGPAVSGIGGIASANSAKDAANTAASAQLQAAQAGINEWGRQFDTVRGLLGPYVQTGTQALGAQGDLAGLNGADKQNAAIQQLQSMPAFQSQLQLGENRILQNASATGGLRGGNTQGALGWFAPSMLAQTINDQYSRLGGLSGMGQNAAAGVGNAGMGVTQGITGLQQQGGAAQAGAAIAGGVADQRMYGGLATAIGQMFGYGGNPMTSGVPTPV